MAASTSKLSNVDGQPSKKSQKSALRKGKAKETHSEPDVTSIPSGSCDEDPWEQATSWNWTSLTDPSSSRIPPVLTKDGSYFFSLVGSSVKIHSTSTGLIVSTLTAPPSLEPTVGSDLLTSAVLNPHNPFQLITGSLDGRILIWDFVNAALLQTITTGQPIHLICAHEQFKGYVFVVASKPLKKAVSTDNNAVVLQVSLKQASSSGRPEKIIPVGKIKAPTGLAISSNGAWLVATAGHKVYVAKTATLSSGFTKYVSPERLTCLAFHPHEDYFATGDEKGVVRLWYCLNDELAVNVKGVEKRTQTRSLHWHAHAVSSISFTPNGAYLLSGGEEAVLVIWQLHTGRKEFVPRVGSPIGTVSVAKSLKSGEEEYLLGLTDATYAFVSSTSLKITRSYSRIKVDPAIPSESASTSKPFSAPIAVHPLTSSLVLPSSHPSSLQIYSPSTSTLIAELEVSPSNRVSRRDDKPIIPSRVEKVVISTSGVWMATVDSRDGDPGFRREIYLKLWLWDGKANNWILNSRIDRPHGTDKVTDISFNPDSQAGTASILVSTGEDGKIKVWQPRLIPGTEDAVWTSHATLNFRKDIPRSISWAQDSSLFAVAVGPHIALYDPYTKMLRRTLTAPDCQTIQFVHFIGREGRHLLATGSKSLVMWDLIDGCVSWQCTQQLRIASVVPHPRLSTFAVFHTSTTNDDQPESKISIFSAASGLAMSVHSLPFPFRSVLYASFESSAGFNIVGVTRAWRVVVCGDSARPLDSVSSAKGVKLGRQTEQRTLFQDIFGVSAFLEEAHSPAEPPARPRKDVVRPAFDTPAFLAPSIDTLFGPVMTTMLSVSEEEQAPKPEIDDPFDDDIVMVDDTEMVATNSHQTARSLYPGEVEALTKLFRTSCNAIVVPPTTPPKVNGKVNGEVMNGALCHPNATDPPFPKKMPPIVRNQAEDTQTLPSPSINGKKRKQLPS